MELFANILNRWKLLIIFAKGFMLDVWLGSEYVPALHKPKQNQM